MMPNFYNPSPQIRYPNTQVYNSAVALAYTYYDVNASAVVGARKALLLLKIVKDATAGVDSAVVRSNDEAANLFSGDGAQKASCDASVGSYVVTLTDSAGIFEFAANDTVPVWTITVVAFIA